MTIRGIYTALITPFLESFEVDWEGLRQLLHLQVQGGVDGLVLLGTTAETPTLTHQEQAQILRLAVEEVGDSLPLIVGTGGPCTRSVIEKNQWAYDLGASGVLVISPYYNRPNTTGLLAHFTKVAQHSPLPLYLYNHPVRTGCSLTSSTVISLAQHPKVQGIKECSSDLSQVNEFLFSTNPHHFSILAGDDACCIPLLSMGASGLVSVASNLYPQQMKDLIQSCLKGDLSQARERYHSLHPIIKACELGGNPAGVKFCMNQTNKPAGPCRLPIGPLTDQEQELSIQWLHQYSKNSTLSHQRI